MGKTKKTHMGKRETLSQRRNHRECDSRKRRGEEIEGEETQIKRSKGRSLAYPTLPPTITMRPK